MIRLVAVISLLILACARRGEAPREAPQTSPMVGSWHLAISAPDGRSPGLRLDLAVDSGTADTFHGRVSLFFSGDVGIDPAEFGPFLGRLTADSVVHILVPSTHPNDTRLRFEGRLAGDTIRLQTFMIGRDTVPTGEGLVSLVRRP